MRELQLSRLVAEWEARRAAGLLPRVGRMHAVHTRSPGLEADLLQLPTNVDNHETLQASDGSFYFQVGSSRVGSNDKVK